MESLQSKSRQKDIPDSKSGVVWCQKLSSEINTFKKSPFYSRHLDNNTKVRPLLDLLRDKGNVVSLKTCDSFFRALPAADLHIHGGALADLDLAVDIAWQRSSETDCKLPGIFGEKKLLRERLANPKPGQLQDYLTIYHFIRDYLFTSLHDIRTVCFEGALHAFYNGTTLLEVRSSIKSGPYGDPACRHTMSGVDFTPEEEFEAMVEGFEQAIRATNGYLNVCLIITFRRGDSIQNIMNQLDQAVRIREHIRQKFGQDYIRGIDIAGTEFGERNKAKRLKNVFRRAHELGFRLTAHSGEEVGVGEGGILHALNHLGVDRIGHGTSLFLPTPLLDSAMIHRSQGLIKNAFIRILQLGVPLETCLTSNIICGAQITHTYKVWPGHRPTPQYRIMSHPGEYPFEILMALGDCVTPGKKEIAPLLSTDGLFTLNTTLAREYSLATSEFNLGLPEVLYLSLMSIDHSFATDETKATLIRQSWLPFAQLFIGNRDESTIRKDLAERMGHFREIQRNRLGISKEHVASIKEEVLCLYKYQK